MTSLRRYFQTSFLLLTILPLLLLGGILCWFVFHTQLNGDIRFIEQRARQAADEIEEFFSFQQEEILDIARFRNFLTLDRKLQHELLLEALAHQPLVQEIALIDAQQNLLQHVSTVEAFSASGTESWFRQAEIADSLISKEVCYSPVSVDPDSLQPLMWMVIPFQIPGQRGVAAVFDVKLRLQVLQQLIHDFEASNPGEQIYITDKAHRIISHPNPSYVLAEQTFAPLTDVGLQKGLNGRWVIIKSAQVEIGEQRFHVVVEQAAFIALKPAWRATTLATVMLLLSLASAIYFSRTARKQIVEPVVALTDTAQAISDGDLARQARVAGHREIRQLATTFNSMTGRLFSSLNSLEEEVKERKSVERKLLHTQASLAFHLQNTPVGAIVWNPDGTVVEWNPAAESIFGYDKAEVLGKSCFDLIILNADEIKLKAIFQSLVEHRSGYANTNENITKGGRIIVCEWHNTPLVNEQGEVYGIASLVTDISERIRLKELMIQSEKMLSLGNMVAGIAHELNNPLAAILQNVQLLENRLLKDIPANAVIAAELQTSLPVIRRYAEQRNLDEFITAISESGQRAARIITSMLSFSRKEQGDRQLCEMPVLVDQVLELLSSSYSFEKNFDFRQIKIERDFSADLPAVPCDPSQLQQVLINLLNNAAQAMSEAKVAAPQIDIVLRADATALQLQISDNGPGMDEKIRTRIFEPFFTTKPVGKGTGLGLSLSYHIITENHQGTLQVAAVPGSGTSFSVSLPLTSDWKRQTTV